MLGPALPFEISEILQKVEVKYSYRQCLSGTLQVLNICVVETKEVSVVM